MAKKSIKKGSKLGLFLRLCSVCVAGLCILGVFFVANGLIFASNNTPQVRRYTAVGRPTAERGQRRLTVVSYNIAKGFAHQGGASFAEVDLVQRRLDQMARVISEQSPDFVFLSEALWECGPTPLDQVEYLAQHTDMRSVCLGENYNIGLPFYRIVGGNAILSKWPLEGEDNIDLAGRQPFYVTKNNRRALFCTTEIDGEALLLGAVHNDSFDLDNNLAQTRQILDFVGERMALIAGDFNAQPDEPPIELLASSGRFVADLDGPPTYPANEPEQVIDLIFAPPSWEIESHEVLDSTASDHRAVVATFVLGEQQ